MMAWNMLRGVGKKVGKAYLEAQWLELFESNEFDVNGEKFLNKQEEDVYLTMKQIKPREIHH